MSIVRIVGNTDGVSTGSGVSDANLTMPSLQVRNQSLTSLRLEPQFENGALIGWLISIGNPGTNGNPGIVPPWLRDPKR